MYSVNVMTKQIAIGDYTVATSLWLLALAL